MGPKIGQALLELVEMTFVSTFSLSGTEDRVLIYADGQGNTLTVQPEMNRRPGSVACNVDLTMEHDGRLWDLAFDLHSHHIMGAFWSSTDSANERIRGPVFGVCSWRGGWPPTWLFRRFNGQGFEDISLEEVVGDG